MMNKLIPCVWGVLFSLVLFSCGENKPSVKQHGYAGVFITEDSIKFELRADSSVYITFPNKSTYESTWMVIKDKDGLEWANIEFGGNRKHYYLKDGQLYRCERNMRHDFLGTKIEYIE